MNHFMESSQEEMHRFRPSTETLEDFRSFAFRGKKKFHCSMKKKVKC